MPKCQRFVFQLEEAGDTKKKHYQGQMTLIKKERMHGIKKWLYPGVHLEPTKYLEESEQYCQKLDSRVEGPWKYPVVEEKVEWPIALRKRPEVWREWQNEVLKIAKNLPDERTVYWVYDKLGGAGKTTLAHELCRNYGGVPVNGALKDILCLASERPSRLYVVVAPRDQKEDEFPYAAVEMLKDGLWMKGKYEVMAVQREELCHVIIFANVKPLTSKLTEDRWHIVDVSPEAQLPAPGSRQGTQARCAPVLDRIDLLQMKYL